MTGQLAVPLHHVEGVGDIAVLPGPFVAAGDLLFVIDPGSDDNGLTPLPVVGQVVAHVEKCANCGGTGQTQARPPFAIGWEVCTGACGGSGWVRDQYVRVTEVLPIWHTDNRPTDYGDPHHTRGAHALVVAPSGVFRLDRNSNDPDYCLDLPGAVPGGVALIVEPAECPECGYDGRFHAGQDRCRSCFPYPVPAPSAPYTETPDE